MKKYNIIPFFLLLCLCISCNDLLEEHPKYMISGNNLFENESDATLALNGCYGYLTSWDVYGQAGTEVQEGASGLFWAQTNKSIQDEFASMNILTNNQLTKMYWSGLYKAIANCNIFLSSLDASTSLSETAHRNFRGQVKFLRGLCYYNLAFTFGDVPLRLDPPATDNVNMKKTPKRQVLEQVERDWLDVIDDLSYQEISDDPSKRDSGTPSVYTAYAYLAKLYWMLASEDNTPSSPYWLKAKEQGLKVIGKYELETKFSTIFNADTRESKESIFRLNMSISSVKDDQGNRNSWIFSPQNSTSGISWGRYRIAKAFYDEFRGTYPNDPRVDASIIALWTNNAGTAQAAYPYYIVKGSGRNAVDTLKCIIDYNDPANNPINPDTMKMTDQSKNRFLRSGGDHQGWPYLAKTFDKNATTQRSNKNVFVYRYADLLLIMADVENELGNTAYAIDNYVNPVLTRARNSATPVAADPQNWPTTLTQSEARVKIFKERQFELFGEGFTYMDVRRRGADFFQKYIMERNNNHTMTKAHAPSNPGANFFDRLLPLESVSKNLRQPIPVEEMNNNTALTIADQNPGY